MNILIAAGGTGGHLFPGIAIAQAFMAKDPENQILFVGTGKPFEKTVLAKAGFQHECIRAEGIKGRGLGRQMISLLKLPMAIFESLKLIRHFGPDLLICMGSYVSGPVAVSAYLMGIPIVLHEQNSVPGITNRMLSCFADRIYVSFHPSYRIRSTSLIRSDIRSGYSFYKVRQNSKKIVFTGNPVREEFRNCFSLPTSHFSLLIVGGSQGARAINLALREAIAYIKEKDRFHFVHQSRPEDEAAVRNAYAEQGISAKVSPFFHDMAALYRKADLVICRAGATTMAEITVLGKAAIFIPYPFAADNHQALNARSLVDMGAGEMISEKDLDAKMLAEKIEYYASHPEALEKMADLAKQAGRPDAAERIVDDCYSFGDFQMR
ncbi:MAG: hypothetical protein B6245_04090 [Desulfobacteraceae bacterium 4572_88]|nr:MAG: hypothetical protein B6245_04090 [Desulfobacteraceae bacterium 4572_88]